VKIIRRELDEAFSVEHARGKYPRRPTQESPAFPNKNHPQIPMIKRTVRTAIIGVAALTSILIASAQQPSAEQSAGQQPSTSVPKAQPNLMPQEKTMHPAPSNGAQQKTQKNSVGKGVLTVTTRSGLIFGKSKLPIAEEVW
jgi:hypothetical protein